MLSGFSRLSGPSLVPQEPPRTEALELHGQVSDTICDKQQQRLQIESHQRRNQISLQVFGGRTTIKHQQLFSQLNECDHFSLTHPENM